MEKPITLKDQSALEFILAARKAEMHSLEVLCNTCQVVQSIADLIHDLQRERGLTNVYLASGGVRLMAAERDGQVDLSRQTEAKLRVLMRGEFLAQSGRPMSSRLLNCIAYVIQGLDELAFLRQQVGLNTIDAPSMTLAFSRLIAGLIEVVIEAADSAGDPVVSRALVAMISFMQGKEYAGQERAWGAIGFARGFFDEQLQGRLAELRSEQERAMGLFEQFASDQAISQWRQLAVQEFSAELSRMRGVITSLGNGDRIAQEFSEIWYAITTARIDALHRIEVQIIEDLVWLSQQQLTTTLTDYQNQEHQLSLSPPQPVTEQNDLMLLNLTDLQTDVSEANSMKVQPSEQSAAMRSVYDLIREQSQHLNEVRAELEETKRALSERKLVEQAKGLLMKNLGLSEEQAYRKIQQRAMDSNMRLADVSQTLIDAARTAGRK